MCVWSEFKIWGMCLRVDWIDDEMVDEAVWIKE